MFQVHSLHCQVHSKTAPHESDMIKKKLVCFPLIGPVLQNNIIDRFVLLNLFQFLRFLNPFLYSSCKIIVCSKVQKKTSFCLYKKEYVGARNIGFSIRDTTSGETSFRSGITEKRKQGIPPDDSGHSKWSLWCKACCKISRQGTSWKVWTFSLKEGYYRGLLH